MIQPSTRISPTRAMAAANALINLAHGQEKAATTFADEFPGAAENCRELGRWYEEVAEALHKLDDQGTPIVSTVPARAS